MAPKMVSAPSVAVAEYEVDLVYGDFFGIDFGGDLAGRLFFVLAAAGRKTDKQGCGKDRQGDSGSERISHDRVGSLG